MPRIVDGLPSGGCWPAIVSPEESDRLHWVGDMDFDEDRSQVRTATGPRIMASLRNLVITILRLARATSIAAALRYRACRPTWPLQTITKC